ncbi:MAG: tetratricopeptide repeat protein [Leptospirales bacterium]|nr:tetratricopeptide repeat protein [Leptospirales bacterium]
MRSVSALLILFLVAGPQLQAHRRGAAERAAPYNFPVARLLPPEFDESPVDQNIAFALAHSAAYYLSASRNLALQQALLLRAEAPIVDETGSSGDADLALRWRYSEDGQRVRAELQIVDLRRDRSWSAGRVEGLRSAPGEMAYQMARAWLEAIDEHELNSRALDAEDRREMDLRFRPSLQPYELFARALTVEEQQPLLALALYRRALAMEPYFSEARDRAAVAAYRGGPFAYRQRRDLEFDLKRQLRSGRRDLSHYAQQLGAVGLSRDRQGDAAGAQYLLMQALRCWSAAGRLQSFESLRMQNELGRLQLEVQSSAAAYRQLAEVRRGLDRAGFHVGPVSRLNLQLLASAAAATGRYSEALEHFDRLAEEAAPESAEDGLQSALLDYNRAAMRAAASGGDLQMALIESRRAAAVFHERGWDNSELAIENLNNQAAILRRLNQWDQSESLFEKSRQRLRMLGLENASIYPSVIRNLSRLRALQGDSYNAQRLGRQAQLAARHDYQRRWTRVRSVLQSGDLSVAGVRTSLQTPSGADSFFTADEEDQVRSFTGAFRADRHPQHILSRTYAGRLDDTNVFLFDLLNRSGDSAPMQALRKVMIAGGDSDGRGLLFVDIGPAIANATEPAVTTRSLARDFPAMQVVALDLPEQVSIFEFRLPEAQRRLVLQHPNLQVLAANGFDPLLSQMRIPARWRRSDRQAMIPSEGQAIVLRAANSIDIYGQWSQIRGVFSSLGQEFEESPVLFFFNQSILYKAPDQRRFAIIGFLSVRGFHHNVNSLDRGGDPPYTLAAEWIEP